MKFDEFKKDVKSKSGGDLVNLKKLGKLICYLHPKSEIEKRNVHWIPIISVEEVEVGKGKDKRKKEKEVVKNIPINCPNTKKHKERCPICNLRKLLRDDEDIDMDEVVLKFEADETVEYLKGDIIGEEGYDWKKNLSYKIEYMLNIVSSEDPEKIETLPVPKTLGKAIIKEIENKQEDEGEDDGDPLKNPYPFKLSYDEDETPQLMYSAKAMKTVKIPKEVQALFDDDPPDLSNLVDPTDPEEIMSNIIPYYVCNGIDIEDLGPIPEKKDKDKEKDEDKKNKAKEEKEERNESKERKTNKKVKDKEEDKEEKKSTGKKILKKPEKVKDEDEEMDECPACGKEVKKSATKCPHCDVEFEEDIIICPHCEEKIPADSKKCPECKKSINPF